MCGRCANVEMPEKPHYECQLELMYDSNLRQNSHQSPISFPSHPTVLERMSPGRGHGANVTAQELGEPAILCYATTSCNCSRLPQFAETGRKQWVFVELHGRARNYVKAQLIVASCHSATGAAGQPRTAGLRHSVQVVLWRCLDDIAQGRAQTNMSRKSS